MLILAIEYVCISLEPISGYDLMHCCCINHTVNQMALEGDFSAFPHVRTKIFPIIFGLVIVWSDLFQIIQPYGLLYFSNKIR